MNHFLDSLMYTNKARSKRISSWDTSGRNKDYYVIEKGQKQVLADIQGPGRITHLWFTQNNPDPDYFRKVTLAFYWDDENTPSILTPLGDFFCLGHSMVNSFQSLPFTVSTKSVNEFGGKAALNCYLPMPFKKRARIEIYNESGSDLVQFFYIDYESFEAPWGSDIAYLHACFNRENPTAGWGHEISVVAPPTGISNLSDKDNYFLLDAEGEGHFIGFNLSVTNLQTRLKNPHSRTWWGEGDEMIFIDGESWPPSIHGTGSEDALNQAYGMQPNAYLFNGSSIYENYTDGYQTSYVFYITNPVRFSKSIRASIEHGHGNHLSNEYSSVAYWYQKEPHKPFGILPVQQRTPLVKTFSFGEGSKTKPVPIELNDEMKAMKSIWMEKYASGEEPGNY